jgi:hypothetical protein
MTNRPSISSARDAIEHAITQCMPQTAYRTPREFAGALLDALDHVSFRVLPKGGATHIMSDVPLSPAEYDRCLPELSAGGRIVALSEGSEGQRWALALFDRRARRSLERRRSE